jgi:hypothetical protein
MRQIACLLVLCLVLGPGTPPACAALPVVEEVDVKLFREDSGRLLEVLQKSKTPIPEETLKTIKGLLKQRGEQAKAAIARVQKLLDPYCLIGVTINPESRVKVQRGPAQARLLQARDTILLIKIQNEAGVTHALKVTGPQLRSRGQSDSGRWLEASIHTEPPLRKTLSGHAVEYVILHLIGREAGKREATLQFNVGQGTQDLGFRAEVPVLFTITQARRK